MTYWRATLTAAGAATLLLSANAALASDKSWQTVADVGLAGLLVAASGETLLEHDSQGARELAYGVAATEAETWGLKHAFPEMRPNGRDRRSFPSGHTSLSFAAATYLDKRYGWTWGAPAFAAATVVGVARVESHDHHWYDVLAGAALGGGTAWLLTKPRSDQVAILPWAGGHGGGVILAARF
jgi:membrane-associated phospholipid phosphatase